MPSIQEHLASLSAPLLAAAAPPDREALFNGTLAQFERLHARNPLAAEGLLRPLSDMPSGYVEKAAQLGNLVKKQITDSNGKRTTVYVRANGEESGAEDRRQVGQKPAQGPHAAPPQHAPAQLSQHAEKTPSDKLLAALNDPGREHLHAAAQAELKHRGVDVHAELQKLKQPSSPDTGKQAKPKTDKVLNGNKDESSPAASTKIDQFKSGNTSNGTDSQAAAAAAGATPGNPGPGAQPKAQPTADKPTVAPGSAPGTPPGWDGDHSFSPDVRAAYNTNVKGIVKAVDKMVAGNAVTAIIYGEGGAGKTYNVEKKLKERGLVPMKVGDPPVKNGYLKITGKITPKAVYEQMYRYKDNLIIFDDCDSALANEDVVNMFKGALDTAEHRMVARVTPEGAKKPAPKAPGAAKDPQAELKALTARVRKGDKTLTDQDYDRWHGLKTGKIKPGGSDPADGQQGEGEEEIPGQFEFKGKILFITNKKPDPTALQPILSRGSAHNATMDREEMLYAMSKNLPFIGVRPGPDGKQPTVPFKEREEIYQFIKDNEKLFPDITMRHFGQVYEDKVYAEKEGLDWQQEVRETLAAQMKEKNEEQAGKGKGLKKSFYTDPSFLEKGSLKPLGTITTLKDGRKTIKTKKGWRILYEGKGKVTHRAPKVDTNFEHRGKRYKVEHDENRQTLKITRRNGTVYKYANSVAMRELTAAYQQQKLAEWASAPRTEWHEGMHSGDYAQAVARTSTNPAEVALEWLNAPETDELDHVDATIAEHLGSFPLASWARFGDQNQLAGTRIKRAYIKPGGQPLDVQAEMMSHTAGVPITEQDIVDFVLRHPQGAHTAQGQESQLRQQLAGRFQQLTGTQVTEQLAQQAAALHVVDELSPEDRAEIEQELYDTTAEDWPWEEIPRHQRIAPEEEDCPF